MTTKKRGALALATLAVVIGACSFHSPSAVHVHVLVPPAPHFKKTRDQLQSSTGRCVFVNIMAPNLASQVSTASAVAPCWAHGETSGLVWRDDSGDPLNVSVTATSGSGRTVQILSIDSSPLASSGMNAAICHGQPDDLLAGAQVSLYGSATADIAIGNTIDVYSQPSGPTPNPAPIPLSGGCGLSGTITGIEVVGGDGSIVLTNGIRRLHARAIYSTGERRPLTSGVGWAQNAMSATLTAGILSAASPLGNNGYVNASYGGLTSPNFVITVTPPQVFVTDNSAYRVRRAITYTSPNDIIFAFAGISNVSTYGGDHGFATKAGMKPVGVAVNSYGDVFISDTAANVIRRVDADNGVITTYAGYGSSTSDAVLATDAKLFGPALMAFDPQTGDLAFADSNSGKVRAVDHASGYIYTLATGLAAPYGLVFDANGDNLYISDADQIDRLDRVTPHLYKPWSGSTAGHASSSLLSSQYTSPTALVIDPVSTYVFVSDTGNHCIRLMGAVSVTDVYGTCTTAGHGNDGHNVFPLDLPIGIAILAGSPNVMLVADSGNAAVRQIDLSSNYINPFIGKMDSSASDAGDSGDGGELTNARMTRPWGIAIQQ